DEIHAAGVEVPVGTVVREVDADVSGTAVWATLEPAPGPGTETAAAAGPVAEARLEWDAVTGSFRGTLAGQPPGLDVVRGETRAGGGAGRGQGGGDRRWVTGRGGRWPASRSPWPSTSCRRRWPRWCSCREGRRTAG